MADLYQSLDHAPAALWDQSATTTVLQSPQWLALPRWPGDGVGYLVNDRTLLPLRTMTDPHGWPSMNLVDICAGESLDLPADPALVAAARTAAVPHLLVAAPGYYTLPVGDRGGEALAGVVDAVRAGAKARGVPYGFGHLPPDADDLLQALRQQGFRDGLASATTRLDLTGSTFDDYLAQLGRSRRSLVRRERARFAAAGGALRGVCGAAVAAWLPVAADLEAELQAAHGFRAEPAFFVEANRAYLHRFGDRMHLMWAELDGEPVASVTVFAGDRDLAMRTVGMRFRPQVRQAAAYFNVTYHGVIELAYRLGLRRIMFGPRSWRAKTLRGARLVPLRAALPPDAPRPLHDLLASTDRQLRDADRWPGQL
jgi:Peptidogalycan biosysnthesis/recognition